MLCFPMWEGVGISRRRSDGHAAPWVLGVLKQMSHNGAHEVMEVAGTGTDARTRLLPWVPAYVKKVDLARRRIEVEWGVDW